MILDVFMDECKPEGCMFPDENGKKVGKSFFYFFKNTIFNILHK